MGFRNYLYTRRFYYKRKDIFFPRGQLIEYREKADSLVASQSIWRFDNFDGSLINQIITPRRWNIRSNIQRVKRTFPSRVFKRMREIVFQDIFFSLFLLLKRRASLVPASPISIIIRRIAFVEANETEIFIARSISSITYRDHWDFGSWIARFSTRFREIVVSRSSAYFYETATSILCRYQNSKLLWASLLH